MSVYRIVLFKAKEGTTQEQTDAFVDEAKKLQGVIPGLVSLKIGSALEMSRTKGFDMGIIVELEGIEFVSIFAKHPAHLRLHEIREGITEDSLAFMLQS